MKVHVLNYFNVNFVSLAQLSLKLFCCFRHDLTCFCCLKVCCFQDAFKPEIFDCITWHLRPLISYFVVHTGLVHTVMVFTVHLFWISRSMPSQHDSDMPFTCSEALIDVFMSVLNSGPGTNRALSNWELCQRCILLTFESTEHSVALKLLCS